MQLLLADRQYGSAVALATSVVSAMGLLGP